MMTHPIFTHGKLENTTLAVGFGTCEQAQQSAREIKMYLDEGWIIDRMLSTPHSDFGCVCFVRPTKPGASVAGFTDFGSDELPN